LEKIPVDLSIIVPVYNEQDNIPLLYEAIIDVTHAMCKQWEVIFINDGSQDKSLTILQELAAQDPNHVRVISFRRNFGQTAAI